MLKTLNSNYEDKVAAAFCLQDRVRWVISTNVLFNTFYTRRSKSPCSLCFYVFAHLGPESPGFHQLPACTTIHRPLVTTSHGHWSSI